MIEYKNVTCEMNVSVYKKNKENGEWYPISTLMNEMRVINVDLNDYDRLARAMKTRADEDCHPSIGDIEGCELLFYKIVGPDWLYYFLKSHDIHYYTSRITLDNGLMMFPDVRLLCLGLPDSPPDSYDLPSRTLFRENPDGTLNLVRAGRDFPNYHNNRSNWMLTDSRYQKYQRPPIPFDKIVKVEDNAFKNSIYLINLTLPNCKEIGKYAFNGCQNLRSVHFPKCKLVGESAFAGCLRLNNVTMDGVEVIENSAFCDCHRLRNFAYPAEVKHIGDKAFQCCMHLEYYRDHGRFYTLPEGVTVGLDAFAYTPLELKVEC